MEFKFSCIKKLFLVLLLVIGTCSPICADVLIDEKHFPDVGFRVYVSNKFDKNGDGILNDSEIQQAKSISLSSGKEKSYQEQNSWSLLQYNEIIYVQSLEGIEYLTALETLDCKYNGLKYLDVSRNNALKFLDCSGNRLGTLYVSNNPVLETIRCSGNQLVTLNTSACPSLKILKCDHNSLTNLIVNNNLLLSELDCSYNRMPTLDLSNNHLLTNVSVNNINGNNMALCYGEWKCYVDLYGLNIMKGVHNDIDIYYVDLNEYVPNPTECVSAIDLNRSKMIYLYKPYNGRVELGSVENLAWIENNKNNNIQFNYDEPGEGGGKAYVTVLVGEKPEVSDNPPTAPAVAKIQVETIGASPNKGSVICGVDDSGHYLDSDGNVLTEQSINNYSNSDYGALGLTADGNSRLIIRVKSDKAGQASFSFNRDSEITLERLTNRERIANNVAIEAEKLDDGSYQISAVFVAPENFPIDKEFPSDTFKVNITFLAEDDEIEEGKYYNNYNIGNLKYLSAMIKTLELKIEVAPVLLIPGLLGSIKNSAIFSGLTAGKFKSSHIYEYSYNPLKTFDEICAGLDGVFKSMFSSYAEEGIVSTKADIVAYGAGGLIVEKFLSDIQKNSSYYKQVTARRLITIATPHYGTPYADLWFNLGLQNNQNPIMKLLINTLIMANKHFIENDNGMFAELQTTAKHDYIFPSGVPIFCIYGNVSDELLNKLIAEFVDRIIKMKTKKTHSFNFKDIPGTALTYALKYSPELIKKYAPRLGSQLIKKIALKCIPLIGLVSVAKDIKDLASLSINLTSGIMFRSQKHDMYVSASSATGDFVTSCIGFDGKEYEHFKIYRQPDIGDKIASLLKGSSSSFSASLAQAVSVRNNTIANTSSVYVSNTDDTEEFEFIETFELSVHPAIFTLAKNESQTVKFTVTTDNQTEDDIYCFIDDGEDGKIFLLPASDDTGKNFCAEVTFDYQDLGTKSIFCFSHNPNDSEGKSIYVSNAAQITVASNVDDISIVSIDFLDNTELSVFVNAETPAELYAIDKDGKYYDISSPLTGTIWTKSEFANVNENGCIYGLKEGITTLTANFRGLSATINVNVGAALTQDNSEEKADTEPQPQPTPEDNDNNNNPSNNEDSPNSGGNINAAPDLDNPSANNAKPEQVTEMQIEGHKAGAYSETVPTTSLTTAEVREILGDKWSNIPFRSMESDMDQTDNRTNEDKEALLEELIEYTEALSSDVLYAFVLRPMKPKQSGIFTFALPLPADMKTGDTLVWRCKRSLSNVNTNTASVYSSDYEEEATFIDTATKEETKIVPESRAISVSTYLEAGYIYEPVVMTVANNSDSQVSGSGGGCNAFFVSVFTLLCGALFMKQVKN